MLSDEQILKTDREELSRMIFKTKIKERQEVIRAFFQVSDTLHRIQSSEQIMECQRKTVNLFLRFMDGLDSVMPRPSPNTSNSLIN